MLPIKTSYEPMEAQLVDELPAEGEWQFEPKWDGFRCLVHRSKDEIHLISKSGKPLDRYFPELKEAVLKIKAAEFVLDSEIVIPLGEGFSFDDLLQRIHPAQSRINKLSREMPAVMIVFDILVDEHRRLLTEVPLEKRRAELEHFAGRFLKGNKQILLSPATTDPDCAREWQKTMGTRLDGIMAKRLDLPYQSGNRKGMIKVKNMRTADCVVGGFRYASGSRTVGSLLLGLYDENGLLNHVGFTSSFNARERKELLAVLEPLKGPPGFTGNAPGGPSRWSTERSTEWEPLAPGLIVEIRYDHFTQGRFRHGTKLLRFRPDKKPEQCTYDQLGEAGKSRA